MPSFYIFKKGDNVPVNLAQFGKTPSVQKKKKIHGFNIQKMDPKILKT